MSELRLVIDKLYEQRCIGTGLTVLGGFYHELTLTELARPGVNIDMMVITVFDTLGRTLWFYYPKTDVLECRSADTSFMPFETEVRELLAEAL